MQAGSIFGNLIISFKGRHRHPALSFLSFASPGAVVRKEKTVDPKASICVGTRRP